VSTAHLRKLSTDDCETYRSHICRINQAAQCRCSRRAPVKSYRDPHLASPRGEPISLIFLHQCDASPRECTASAAMHLGHYVSIQKPLTGICKSLNGNDQPSSQFHRSMLSTRGVYFTKINRCKILSPRPSLLTDKRKRWQDLPWHGSEIRETKARWNERFSRPAVATNMKYSLP